MPLVVMGFFFCVTFIASLLCCISWKCNLYFVFSTILYVNIDTLDTNNLRNFGKVSEFVREPYRA